MLKPRNIQDINVRVKHIGSYYRIRHIDTLEDYCICGVVEYADNGLAKWFKGFQLDSMLRKIHLPGDHDKFVLLSCREEIEYFSRIHHTYLCSELMRCYPFK